MVPPMNYRVNASVRNAQGRELLHRTPLWHGEAESSGHALHAAYTMLVPIIQATADADTIVLHIIDGAGTRTTVTEYAEDFRGEYGSSASKTGLLADKMASMTPEQLESAKQSLAADAVRCMPQVLDEAIRREPRPTADPDAPRVTVPADAVRDFFGGRLPSERAAPAATEPTWSDGEEFREVVKRVADAQDAKRQSSARRTGRPVEPNYGGFGPSITIEPMRVYDSALSDPVGDVRAGISKMRDIGREVERIIMTPKMLADLAKASGAVFPGALGRHYFEGLPIEVTHLPLAAPIVMVPKPRNTPIAFMTPGKFYISHNNYKAWHYAGEVK